MQELQQFYQGSLSHCKKYHKISANDSHSAIIVNSDTIGLYGIPYPNQLSSIKLYDEQEVTRTISFQKIITAPHHGVLLSEEGRVYTWGSNSLGQLGLSDINDRLTPTLVALDFPIASLSASASHTALVTECGQLILMGLFEQSYSFEEFGIVTDGPENGLRYLEMMSKLTLPRLIATSFMIRAVISGDHHLLLISQTDQLYLLGENDYGELGFGDNNSRLKPTLLPTAERVKYASAGDNSSAFITESGKLYTFGQIAKSNKPLLLQVGRKSDSEGPEANLKVAEVSLGTSHAILLTTGGMVYTFGEGWDGQLGHGNMEHSVQPKLLRIPGKVTYIRAYQRATTVVTADSQIYTFGRITSGIMGEYFTFLRPTIVLGL